MRLITLLQLQQYSTKTSCVELVETLLVGQTLPTRQALFWFAPFFEKNSLVLSNFEAFLATFAEAFGDHDKVRFAIIEIQILQ